VEIPDVCEYSEQMRKKDNFNHYDVPTIWNRLAKNNGKDVKTWERVDSKKTVEAMIVEWQALYFGQSAETPLTSNKWERKLQSQEFCNKVLNGEITPEETENVEIFEFLYVMRVKRKVPEIEFIYTFLQFKQMIKKTKEKKLRHHQDAIGDITKYYWKWMRIRYSK